MPLILKPFSVWADVLAYVRKSANGAIWYQAPLDARPVLVKATCRPNGRTVRIAPWGFWRRGQRPFDPFTADAGHLDRFRRPFGAAWVTTSENTG